MMANARIALALVFVARLAAAAEVTIGATVSGAPAEKRPLRIEATAATAGVESVTTTMETGGHTTLALQPGVWYVAASAKGLWSAPLPVVVSDAPLAASITMYPAATLTGKVALPKGSHPARVVSLSFQAAPADEGGAAVPSSSIACPVGEDGIACDVPAGKLDLSVHIPMHVPIYRWGLAAAATTDLGTLTFRRGTSISGTVVVPPGRALRNTEVTLTPLSADETEKEHQRKPLTVLRARPNERGFFLIVTAPGDYRIEANAEGLISNSQPVRLFEGKEARLREPLRLAPPRLLSVRVDPPHDPWGKPWIVTLQRHSERGVGQWEKTAPLPLTGTWRSPPVPPGMYGLYIRRRGEDAWYATEVIIEDDDQTIEAHLDFTQVVGKITLGGEPLRANLWFGGKVAGISVPLHSRADGTFRMMLPSVKNDVWERVDIEADSPFVKRTVENVRLERSADSPLARVTIELPATRLEGRVVDESGAPIAAPALVDLSDIEKQSIQWPTEAGMFSVAGLPPGTVRLRASTRDQESDTVVVEAVAGQTTNVTLTLMERTVFTGVVQSPWGPAANAAVVAQPFQRGFYFVPYVADDAGRFNVPLPPQTTEARAAVYAPAFALRLLRVRAQGEPAAVLVDQTGGSLTVDIADTGPTLSYLAHNGAHFPVYHLAGMVRAGYERGEDGRSRFTFPLVEEGVYSLCIVRPEDAAAPMIRPERCTTGYVARHGSLTLRAPLATSN